MESTSRANINTSLSIKANDKPKNSNNKTLLSKVKHFIHKIFSIPFFMQMYIIIHIIFSALQLLYLYITKKSTNIDVILCCITLCILLFMLLIYIFTHIRTWNYTQILIGIFMYVIYYYQFFFITLNTAEYTHKFYYLLMITNLTLGFSLGENNFIITLIHLIIVLLGNLAVIIYFSILVNKFAIESLNTFYLFGIIFISFNLFMFFTIKQRKKGDGWKLPYFKTRIKNACMNNKNEENTTLKIKEFCQMLNMGYISCSGEKFEVEEYNEIIENNFLFLISRKNRNGEIIRRNNYTSSFCRDVIKNKRLSIARNKPMLATQKTFMSMINEDPSNPDNALNNKYFDVQFFSQKKEENDAGGFYGNENCCIKQKITLSELIINQKETNRKKRLDKNNKNFVNLGLFKFSKRNISIYFNIFMKYIPNMRSPKKDTFEFILNEIPSQKANKVILSNYENTLKKIAHEIKTPSMNIQKITEMLLIENEHNKSNSPMLKSTNNNELILIHSDQLQTIKYLSEICLLTVRDIVEHASLLNFDQFKDNDYEEIRLNTKEEEQTKAYQNKKSSFLSLQKFVFYVKQLARTYLFMLNKKVEIDFIIPKAMDDSQIIIDEQKLNQVISNLLTNAIKSTPENKKIIFTMSLLESNNYRNALFNQTACLEQFKITALKEKDEQLGSARMQKKKKSVLLLGIRITLEDSGSGMDIKNMREINDKHVHEVNEIHDYSEAKGIGSGIKISKKLCDEMGVEIKCELITREGIVKVRTPNNEIIGTKITLDIIGEIFPSSISQEDSLLSEKTRVESEHIYNINPNDKDLLNKNCDNDFNNYFKANTNLSKISLNMKGIIDKIDSIKNLTFKKFPSYVKDTDSSKCQLKESPTHFSFALSDFPTIGKKASKGFQRRSKKKSTYSRNRKLLQQQTETKQPKRLSNNNLGSHTNLSPRSPKHSCPLAHKLFKHKCSVHHHGYEKSVITYGQEDSYVSKPTGAPQFELESVVSDNKIGICAQDGTETCNCNNTNNNNNNSEYQDLEVIIVDDDNNITDSIKRIVNNLSIKNNYTLKVKIFCDGMELLYDLYSGLKKNIFTNKVILCDEMMKYINGSEAYAMIVKYFEVVLKSILFISISAFSDGAHKKKLGQMGVEHIYEKPITKGNIEYIFNNIVKKKFPIQIQGTNA